MGKIIDRVRQRAADAEINAKLRALVESGLVSVVQGGRLAVDLRRLAERRRECQLDADALEEGFQAGAQRH